jgi:hypothetical protein
MAFISGLWAWKETSVCQIYPRSFQDSDGDGLGNLAGSALLPGRFYRHLWFGPLIFARLALTIVAPVSE